MWDTRDEKILGERICGILDDAEIAIADIAKQDIDSNEGYEAELEWYTDLGEDYVFYVPFKDAEDFSRAFEEFTKEFDAKEHAKFWIENKDLLNAPTSKKELLEDAKGIKEHLENVSSFLKDINYERKTPSVHFTLDGEEIDKLIAAGKIERDYSEKDVADAIHKMVADIPYPDREAEEISTIPAENWLREQIELFTDENGCLNLEPASYDDKLSESLVLNAFNDAFGSDTSFEATLYDAADGALREAMDYEEVQMMDEIEKRLEDASPEVQKSYEALMEKQDFWDAAYENGYEGINIDLPAFLDTYKVNIMFATAQERNYDMSSIMNILNTDISDIGNSLLSDPKEFKATADNAMTYLIHQQGHTLEEVLSEIHGKTTGNEFVKSVKDEVEGHCYDMSELTALVSVSGQEVIDLLNGIVNGKNYITFPENTRIGLFNEWNGSGSNFEIQLEKPATIPCNMVRNLQVESRYDLKENDGYTVNEAYGLVPSCWDGEAKATTEQPILKEEDMAKTQKSLKAMADKEKGKNNIER